MNIPEGIQTSFFRKLAVLKLIWVIFFISMGLMAVVAYLTVLQASTKPYQPPPNFVHYMPLVGAFLGLLAFLIRIRILGEDKIKEVMRSVNLIEHGLRALPLRLVPAFIICFVLNEAVALLGLLQSVLCREMKPFWPYLVGALILHFLSYPRVDRIFETAVSSSRAF